MALVPLQHQRLDVQLGYEIGHRLVMEVQVVAAHSKKELCISLLIVHCFDPVFELPLLTVNEHCHHSRPLGLGET